MKTMIAMEYITTSFVLIYRTFANSAAMSDKYFKGFLHFY